MPETNNFLKLVQMYDMYTRVDGKGIFLFAGEITKVASKIYR